MIHAALSSSAFVGADIPTVLKEASAAGAQGLEWSDAGFLVPGDESLASDTMMGTLKAGLTTVSYLSSYRACVDDREAFLAALRSARALNAPILRLGLGASPKPRAGSAAFLETARSLGDEAGAQGVTLCFGLASGTVLGSYAAAAGLMAELDHPFVKLAWEPDAAARFDDVMDGFAQLAGTVGLMIVNHGDLDGEADARAEEWLQYLDAYDQQGGSLDMSRPVVVRSVPFEAGRAASTLSAIKSWSKTLRRYHRLRVY